MKMVLNIYLGLMAVSLGMLIFPRCRWRKLSILLLGVAVVFLYLLLSPVAENGTSWSYNWLPYAGLQSSLDIFFNESIRQMLLPVAFVLVSLFYLSLIYPAENNCGVSGALLLLSIMAFVVVVSAAGFVQLMAGSCLYTILGFYLIDRIGLKKKSLFYDFIAEMALFSACSVVYGSLGSINISQSISGYAKFGEHKDLVAILLIVSVFAKAGLFPFQNKLIETQDMVFSRIISLFAVMTPLAALLIFAKLQPLVTASPYGKPLVIGGACLSFAWGIGGALLKDSVKAKAIYLNLIFYAGAMLLLCRHPNLLAEHLLYFIPVMVLLDYLLLIVVVSASNEIYISQMGGFAKNLKLNFTLSLGGLGVFLEASRKLLDVTGDKVIILISGSVLIVFAHIFYEIYLGKNRSDERVVALLHNVPPAYLLPLSVLVGWSLYSLYQPLNKWEIGGIILFFLFLFAGPLRFVRRWADSEALQETDWTERFYRLFVLMPVRLLGRILWITVDFLFIERTVISSLSQSTGMLVSGLHKIQKAVWLNYLLMFFIGLGIFIAVAGRYYNG